MVANLVDLRDTAVNHIKNTFTEKGFHIASHPGRFTVSDIKEAAQRTPAILTSILRARESDDSVEFASFILYRATNVDRLYNGALSIASKLIATLKALDHNYSLNIPEEISAECLFSGSLEQINITLWAVSWSWHLQPHTLAGELGSLDDLDFFNGFDAVHNVGSSAVNDSVNIQAE